MRIDWDPPIPYKELKRKHYWNYHLFVLLEDLEGEYTPKYIGLSTESHSCIREVLDKALNRHKDKLGTEKIMVSIGKLIPVTSSKFEYLHPLVMSLRDAFIVKYRDKGLVNEKPTQYSGFPWIIVNRGSAESFSFSTILDTRELPISEQIEA